MVVGGSGGLTMNLTVGRAWKCLTRAVLESDQETYLELAKLQSNVQISSFSDDTTNLFRSEFTLSINNFSMHKISLHTFSTNLKMYPKK